MSLGDEKKFLTFDLGGDALSVTIVIMDEDGALRTESEGKDHNASGNAFDKILFKLCTEHFQD